MHRRKTNDRTRVADAQPQSPCQCTKNMSQQMNKCKHEPYDTRVCKTGIQMHTKSSHCETNSSNATCPEEGKPYAKQPPRSTHKSEPSNHSIWLPLAGRQKPAQGKRRPNAWLIESENVRTDSCRTQENLQSHTHAQWQK